MTLTGSLQNRVLPDGRLVRSPARGTLCGNRGCLHDAHRQIVRRWTTKAWIACRLEWKGVRREIMAPGRWTELFFLDEAVALAAGHRPCACCRRGDYNLFREAWARAFGALPRASAMDAVLHPARLVPPDLVDPATLPDGCFVRMGDVTALVRHGRGVRYSPEGYGEGIELTHEVEALTSPPMRAVLAAGYRPMLHPGLGVRSSVSQSNGII